MLILKQGEPFIISKSQNILNPKKKFKGINLL